MNVPILAPHHAEGGSAVIERLPEQTREWAQQASARVAQHYLAFRRTYYHEANPTLETPPPAHAEIHQAEVARLADNTLRLLPQAVRSVPVLGGLLEQLQQVANIHSMSERERSMLHNLTMTFLHGVRGGIQPWYAGWLLASARTLYAQPVDRYFMQYPWDALLYQDTGQLQAFEAAMARDDAAGIERVLDRIAAKLIHALDDPIGVQPDLAFTGPDGERRRLVFRLKTSAALALGAYFVMEEARVLLRPHEAAPTPHSALAPLPPELAAFMTPGDKVGNS
ncbi:MAG TPA: hypothetical protein VGR57_19220 [Ktedonobacterales bacterium]|nr:hypothetical protein [Ktedonobacterales bacterium]